ncbi:MAG TPA: uracil-DNA glycosylase [Candidatus Limnocylindrales bacterium]|nr:uracil-DNA glycosylase [Candidatus Limnocylindrales bacterium]
MSSLEALLDDLARARIGTTFNQFREHGPDDLPGAARIRLANLRRYLAERAAADVVAIGEAAGYQGMRWTGIAFTSEFDLLRWGAPYQRTSLRPRPWKEPSGTIVHGLLAERQAERRVILWNVVPTHPHEAVRPLSNRLPTRAEVEAGLGFTHRLLQVLGRDRMVVAIGKVAAIALGDLVTGGVVRHPANAGATRFRREMAALLT